MSGVVEPMPPGDERPTLSRPRLVTPTLPELLAELERTAGTAVLRVREGARSVELRVDRGRILGRDGLAATAAFVARLLAMRSAVVDRLPAGARAPGVAKVALPTDVVLEEAKLLLRRAERLADALVPSGAVLEAVLPAPASLTAADALVLARFSEPRSVLDVLLDRHETLDRAGESVGRLLGQGLLVPASVAPVPAPPPPSIPAPRRSTLPGSRPVWWERDRHAPVVPAAVLPSMARSIADRTLAAEPTEARRAALAVARALFVEPVRRPASLEAALELAAQLRGDGTSLGTVASVMGRHRSLAVAVIGEASTAAHGRTIDSLERAVLRVGLERVHHLACELVLDEIAGRTTRASVRFERRLALVVAKLAGALAPRAMRSDAVLAGLLSGLGHVLLETRGPQLEENARREIDRQLHATLAATHAVAWNVSDAVAIALGQYVRPLAPTEPALIRIVRAARIAASFVLAPESVRLARSEVVLALTDCLPETPADEILARARALDEGA